MSNHEPRLTGTKTCVRCGLTLHVLCFAVNKETVDGLDSYCRECHREISLNSPSRSKRKSVKLHIKHTSLSFKDNY